MQQVGNFDTIRIINKIRNIVFQGRFDTSPASSGRRPNRLLLYHLKEFYKIAARSEGRAWKALGPGSGTWDMFTEGEFSFSFKNSTGTTPELRTIMPVTSLRGFLISISHCNSGACMFALKENVTRLGCREYRFWFLYEFKWGVQLSYIHHVVSYWSYAYNFKLIKLVDGSRSDLVR